MSLITDTWRQLVRRRLWPVAVLLLGALVAVPVLLARSPAAVPPLPVPATADETAAPAGGGLTAQPLVAVADQGSRGRRHVLGPRKDPFEPAPPPKKKTAKKSSEGAGAGIGTGQGQSSGDGSSVGGGSSSGGTSVPSTPVGGGAPYTPVTPVAPTSPSKPSTPRKRVAPGTLTVRFGDATSDSLSKLTLKKLDALPDADTPVAIYLGPGRRAHTAQFLLDASVRPEGDATCLPSAADCQKIELREGETEFLEVTDDTGATTGQFELDLVHVAGKAKAKKANGARASRARAARAGVAVARVVGLLHP